MAFGTPILISDSGITETSDKRNVFGTTTAAVISKEATRVYQVDTTLATDTCAMAMAVAGLPVVGDTYADDGYLKCVGRTGKMVQDSRWTFEITCTFRSPSQPVIAGGKAFTNWNMDMTVTSVETVYPCYQDKDGHPIVNTAQQYFEPTCNLSVYDKDITVSFFSTFVPVSSIDSCLGKVNGSGCSLTINGLTQNFTARQVKLIKGDFNTVYEHGLSYWRISYTWRFRADTWHNDFANKGTQILKYVGGGLPNSYDTPKDANGEPISGQVNLTDYAGTNPDGTGLIGPDTGKVLPPGQPVVILHFKLEKECDFAPLFAHINNP